jgi:DNA replication protein DnaC
MLNQPTFEKLLHMRFSAMAASYRQQTEDQNMAGLSFEDRFGMLVDAEYWSRHNNRLKRNIHKACLDQPQATLADINYTSGRLLDKSLIQALGTGQYIRERHNVIILGATGSGKTYLGCAFGMEACKQGFTVKYIRLQELLEDLAIARGQGAFKKVITQYKKYDLLILDEWMLVSLTETEARDLLEIIHSRHKRGSTVFCSQFEPVGWLSKLPEATIADAILDRIVHDSYTIEIRAAKQEHQASMREIYGLALI